MRHALRTTAGLTFLAVLLGTVAGCGTGNPVGPMSTNDVSTMETARGDMTIVEPPAQQDPGAYAPDPYAGQMAEIVAKKKARKAKRGHGQGHS